MVVRRGEDWGSDGIPSGSVPRAFDDGQIFDLLRTGHREFCVVSGDLARTLGSSSSMPTAAFRRVPLDLIQITLRLDDGSIREVIAASHCFIRRSWWRGGVFTGKVLLICNAQYFRGLDVAPRGHPNDGKIEILEFSSQLGSRDRLKVFRRSRTGDHLPHPFIRFVQCASPTRVDTSGVVFVDGRKIGKAQVESCSPLPDMATAWIPLPPESLEGQD